MEKISAFLQAEYGDGSGDGSGDGDGYGYGDGSGDGYGSGSGYGSGYGDGYGDGSGDGSGSGYGDGYGYGDGSGYGDGYGYGDGSGYGIKTINGQRVDMVDNVPTLIKKVKGNVAKGFILSPYLTFKPCYVVKHENLFAHGKTLHKAQTALESKIFANINVEERIERFIEKFNAVDKYPASDFFNWHNKLTGSCEMGRKDFAESHDIDLEHDSFTVSEFIALTENSFGGGVIKKLKEKMTEMPRYIDADGFFDKLLKTKDGLQEHAAKTDDHQEIWMAEGMQAFLSDLNHTPTVNAAPIVHGKWENREDIPHCTVCDYIPAFDLVLDDIYYSPFCPNCGAKMDLED